MIIEIVNYKTIKHVKFEFTGFASIVGPNFIGKSAIVGAVVSCLSNSMDKSAIREGESFTEVRYVRGDLDVFWHYEEGNTYYVINGQEYKKLGGAIPPPLVEAGYAPLAIAEEKEYLWHIPQFQPLFVVDRDRSNFATDLLAAIFKFDSVYKALDLCKKEMREVSAKAKMRETDLLNARDALAPLQPLERYLQDVSDNAPLVSRLEKLSKECQDMDAWLSAMDEGRGHLKVLLPVRSMGSLSLEELGQALSDLREITVLAGKLGEASAMLRALKGVPGLPPVPDPSDVEMLANEVRRMSTLLQSLREAAVRSDKLGAVRDLPAHPADEVGTLSALLQEVSGVTALQASLSAAASEVRRFRKVSDVPAVGSGEISSCGVLLEEVGRLAMLHGGLQGAIREVQEAKAGLARASADLDAGLVALSEYKACPACGQSLKEEGDHAH